MSSENTNKGPKKSSGGFSHFIHNVEKKAHHAVSVVKEDLHKAGSAVAHDIKAVPHIIEEGALSVAHGAQRVASGVADTIQDIEHKILPSPSAIIGESAIALVGLGLVTILVFKFL